MDTELFGIHLQCKSQGFDLHAKKVRNKSFAAFLESLATQDIFYLPIKQKREYMDIISDVENSYNRKYICQKEKCIYVESQNGKSHKAEREYEKRNNILMDI